MSSIPTPEKGMPNVVEYALAANNNKKFTRPEDTADQAIPEPTAIRMNESEDEVEEEEVTLAA